MDVYTILDYDGDGTEGEVGGFKRYLGRKTNSFQTEWRWGMKTREGPKVERLKKKSVKGFGEKKHLKGILGRRTC